jgi:hypothetical protein
MTAPAAPPARKRLRLASLLATAILGTSGLALFAGGGTAYADPHCPIYINGRDVGGTYDCRSLIPWFMPNGYVEEFVIAPDNSVWTIWSSSSGISSWRSLGGKCAFGTLGLGTTGDGWSPYLVCEASNGDGSWYDQRVDTGNGTGYWTGWNPTA